MPNTSLVVLFAFQSIALSQDDPLKFYYPDGRLYTGTAKTMNDISGELEDHGRVYVHHVKTSDKDELLYVGYKLFTTEPLWILATNDSRIPVALELFDLQAFFNSRDFISSLEKFIKKGTLTDIYVLQSLGQPTKKTRSFANNEATETWIYESPSVSLMLKDGIVKGYSRDE
jgi:hypothetical protein